MRTFGCPSPPRSEIVWAIIGLAFLSAFSLVYFLVTQ